MRRLRSWWLARQWMRRREQGFELARLEAEVMSDAVATVAMWDSFLVWPEIRDGS